MAAFSINSINRSKEAITRMIGIAQEIRSDERVVPRTRRRSISGLLAPLYDAVKKSPHLLASDVGGFCHDRHRYTIPRFIFIGPGGDSDPIRLGIFAGIHGDEPEGVLALARFLGELVATPALATGYRIYAYPVANPTGFEDNTRPSRS